jgi:hypothetical protein
MRREYAYRPRWTVIIAGVLFFGVGTIVLGVAAYHPKRPTDMYGIQFSPEGAATFYMIFAALSFCFVLLSEFLAYVRIKIPQRVVLTDTSIIIPRKRWSSEEITVPFSEIIALRKYSVCGQWFLDIHYHGGNFTLVANMLPQNKDLDEICATLMAKCGNM